MFTEIKLDIQSFDCININAVSFFIANNRSQADLKFIDRLDIESVTDEFYDYKNSINNIQFVYDLLILLST